MALLFSIASNVSEEEKILSVIFYSFDRAIFTGVAFDIVFTVGERFCTLYHVFTV